MEQALQAQALGQSMSDHRHDDDDDDDDGDDDDGGGGGGEWVEGPSPSRRWV